jgi:enoyl-CoA hydratase
VTADSTDILLIDTTDRVRTVTLNRPESRNALSSALRTQFFAALREAEADDGVDVVIVTGADPVFCAGLDLKELGNPTDLPDISPKWPPMTKPVIGAINGAAVTGGLELALYCDILIASERARFADTHARVGLLPTWGLSVRLPQKVGVGMARRMSMTGDYLSAADALRAGLVTEVVAHEALMPTARAVAASIVGNNQKSVRALLESYHRIDEEGTGAGLWLEAEAARKWMRSATGDDIAASRAGVMERGRTQARQEDARARRGRRPMRPPHPGPVRSSSSRRPGRARRRRTLLLRAIRQIPWCATRPTNAEVPPP